MLHRAADNLSATEVATLVEFPDAVRLALIVAANALFSEEVDRSHIDKSTIETITGEAPHYVSSADAYRQMSKRTKPGKSEDLLTTSELAAQIGLKTRQSVHNWLRKGKIIGWRGAKRGYVFPALQFDNLSRPLKGLERITLNFGDGYAAWVWLTTPHPSLLCADSVCSSVYSDVGTLFPHRVGLAILSALRDPLRIRNGTLWIL